MPSMNRVDILIEHYKQNLDDAEIVFQDVCENTEPPKFQMPHEEISLTATEKEEFIRRYIAEIAPLALDLKRIR